MKSHKHLHPEVHATTVIGVIKDGKAAIGADGQVSFNNTILKHNTKKVRKVHNGQILVGFAGSTADAFTLLQKFEEKLEAHRGTLQRASIELAKEWRTDRYLRKLEAMLIAMTNTEAYIISGTGDVVQPDDSIVAIGSGGSFALSAARALYKHSNLNSRQIVEESLRIASEICIYTNDKINIEEI